MGRANLRVEHVFARLVQDRDADISVCVHCGVGKDITADEGRGGLIDWTLRAPFGCHMGVVNFILGGLSG